MKSSSVGVKAALGFKGRNRAVQKDDQGFVLRKSEADYAIITPEKPILRTKKGSKIKGFCL